MTALSGLIKMFWDLLEKACIYLCIAIAPYNTYDVRFLRVLPLYQENAHTPPQRAAQ